MSTTKQLLNCIVLMGALASSACAQDHLSMNITYDDSTLNVEAVFTSSDQRHPDSVYFILHPGYSLDTIQASGLTSYAIKQKPGIPLPYYKLSFDPSVKHLDSLRVMFDYSIDLAAFNHLRSDWIELNADKLWYPHIDGLTSEFTYDVVLKGLPKSFRVITHSDANVTKKAGTYNIKRSEPWYEVFLLAGREMRVFQYDQGIRLIASKEVQDSTLTSMGEKTRKSIDLLNETFGNPDPITSFIVVLRNTPPGELNFQFNRGNMIITGPEFNDIGNLAHEISHYWWSRANFMEEPWMNESFANYSMYVVLREFDREEYHSLLQYNRKRSEDAIPVAQATQFVEDAYVSYYHKGAIHLMNLEERIGEETMHDILSECIARDVTTTQGFLEQVSSHASKKESDFFREVLHK